MKGLFNIQIALDVENGVSKENDKVTGDLVLTANETVNIVEIESRLLRVVRGKCGSAQKLISSSQILSSKMSVLQNEEYRFPFTVIHDSGLESYKGKNVSIGFEIEIAIKLADEEYERLGTDFFERMKSKLLGNRPLKYTEGLILEDKNRQYFTLDEDLKLQVLPSNLLTLIFTVIVAPILYFLIPISDNFIILLIVGICIALGLLLSKIFTKVLIGNIMCKVRNINEDGFSFTLLSNRNWRPVIESNLYYTIIEEVIDSRGTNSETYVHQLYISDKKKVRNKWPEAEIQFSYPDIGHIKTLQINNVVIRWMINLDIKTSLGVKIECFEEFSVKKR